MDRLKVSLVYIIIIHLIFTFDCVFLRISSTEKKMNIYVDVEILYEIMNIFANEIIAQFNNFDILIVNNN